MKNAARKNNEFSYALMLLCSYALMLLCPPSAIDAAELPETARLLPPETVVLLDIDNFTRLEQQFKKTSLYQLYKDPAMAAFLDDFKAKWKEEARGSKDEFARIIADAAALPQGRAAVALVFDEQTIDANEPPILLIAEWDERTEKVKEAIGKMVEKAVEDGARRKTEDYRGVSITTITIESSTALSYCFIDDCLIGSMLPDVLKFVIAHIKGAGSPTLADDDDFTATTRAVGPPAEGQIDLYVSIKQAIKAMTAVDDTGKTKTMITNLGLDNVTSLGCSIDLARGPGGSSFGKAFLKIDGDKKGICKMLDMESAALRVPQFVPASAYSVSFINLNFKKAYNELAGILSRVLPQFAMLMYIPLTPPGPQGEPPLQLQNGIIDHLGSQIIIAQSIDKSSSGATGETQRPAAAESLVAVAVNNRNALEKTLLLLHNMVAPNNPDARRELLGHTIYLVDVSGLLPGFISPPRTPVQAPVAPGTARLPRLAFTVTDTHLIFASEAAVERAIRALSNTEAEPLRSAKWFTEAKSNIPSVVGLADLQNSAASGEQFWTTLRESKEPGEGEDSSAQLGVGAGSGSALPLLMLSQAGPDMFDFSLLPEFDAVRKYFGLSAFYGISRPDGFFFEFKYLNPDATE
jgi:hypothetical protein